MVFEAIRKRELTERTRIRVSATAARRPPSKLGLKPGQTITVGQVIRALVTKSANDAASAIAEHMSGSESAFARAMTRKARAIGMKRTTFRNASGLPDRAQVTTARDMIKLALRLQDDFPRLYRHFRRRSFGYRGKTYRNHNTLLRTFRGSDGIKTGYTRASGFNLVSSVRRGRRHVVAAVFGGSSAGSRNAKMRRLLTAALKKASTRRTRRPAGTEQPLLIARPRPVARPANPVSQNAKRQSGRRVRLASVRRVELTGRRAAAVVAPKPSLAAPPKSITELLLRVRAAGSSARRGYKRQPVRQRRVARANARRARPASTLGAQASAIQTGDGLRAARKSNDGSIASGGVQIQVGAFFSEREAQQQVQTVQSTHRTLLRTSTPVTVMVDKGRRRLYRARFAGFDRRSAAATCFGATTQGCRLPRRTLRTGPFGI